MRKGEIWFVEIPASNGREQEGLRPVVLVSEMEAQTAVVIPFTSNIQALKYPHTLEVAQTAKNGLKTTSVALIFQLRAIDLKRLKNRIGVLEKETMVDIEKLIKSLLEL